MVVVDEAQFRLLPATIATARAYRALAMGDLSDAVKYAQQASRLTPVDDHIKYIQANTLLSLAQYTSGDLEGATHTLTNLRRNSQKPDDLLTTIGITLMLAEIKGIQGKLQEALHIYKQALQLVTSPDTPVSAGMAELHRGISELHCEQGDMEAATHHLLIAKELGRQTLLIGGQYRLCIAEARIMEAQGDLDRALCLLDDAERLYVSNPLPDVHPAAALRARIWVAQGKLTEALIWAQDQGLTPDDHPSFIHEFEYMVLVRMLIARYRNEQADNLIHSAMKLLERLLLSAEDSGRQGSIIEILVLQAIAYHVQNNIPFALASLKRALALAEPEGYIQVFVHEEMATLLQEAEKHGITSNHIIRLKAALSKIEREMMQPLSKRELEVLMLLKTDLSGPEIASTLTIALSTMRTHTQNIYSKLGVTNRRLAVRRAEELNLL
jgi:LuxR family maltose regulon positive regulatory protein